jgi:hypothetical protein
VKDKYYSLIDELGIYDYLSYLEDYPYSKKKAIIEDMLKRYDKKMVNRILHAYKHEYIDCNRVSYKTLIKDLWTIGVKLNIDKDKE